MIIIVLNQICFDLLFFLISGMVLIFLEYCIQNLLKSDSLKINPELRQLCIDILQNGYHWVVTWKLSLCPWKSFSLLKPAIFRTCRKLSSLSSHSSGGSTGLSPEHRWVRGVLQQGLFCGNLNRIDLPEILICYTLKGKVAFLWVRKSLKDLPSMWQIIIILFLYA